MTDHHQIIIINTDMHTIDLEPFQYSGTNITGIRMVDPENPHVVQVTNFIADSLAATNEDVPEGLEAGKMRSQTALVYDAVLLLAEAVRQLDVEQLKPRKLNCNNLESWDHGNSVTNFMRNVIFGIQYTKQPKLMLFLSDCCTGPNGRSKIRQ